jgi:hypothetical protein
LPTQAEVSRTLQLIRDHPQMTDLDKANVVSVLAQAPRFAAAVANAPAALLPRGYTRERQPDWEQYMSLKGIVASSQKPVPPEKVYKIRGVGEVEGEPEVSFCSARSHFFGSWRRRRRFRALSCFFVATTFAAHASLSRPPMTDPTQPQPPQQQTINRSFTTL